MRNNTAGYLLLKLLSIIAVFHLAVGIHLVHPALHTHLEHSAHEHSVLGIDCDHSHDTTGLQVQENSGEPIYGGLTKWEAHLCPICNLLATNQFYPAKSALSYKPFRQPHEIVSFSKAVHARLCIVQHQPRAPPLTVFTRIPSFERRICSI